MRRSFAEWLPFYPEPVVGAAAVSAGLIYIFNTGEALGWIGCLAFGLGALGFVFGMTLTAVSEVFESAGWHFSGPGGRLILGSLALMGLGAWMLSLY